MASSSMPLVNFSRSPSRELSALRHSDVYPWAVSAIPRATRNAWPRTKARTDSRRGRNVTWLSHSVLTPVPSLNCRCVALPSSSTPAAFVSTQNNVNEAYSTRDLARSVTTEHAVIAPLGLSTTSPELSAIRSCVASVMRAPRKRSSTSPTGPVGSRFALIGTSSTVIRSNILAFYRAPPRTA